MSIRLAALLSVVACLFAAGFLAIIVAQRNNQSAPRPKAAVQLASFAGSLNVQSIDDLRVGGRKVLLCGAAFTKPRSMRDLVTEAARQNYQGLALNCKPVGTGTPCDGNMAPTFEDTMVVQCFTSDGVDLASTLARDGFLCGQPSQAGATYKPC
ncbi:MAG: hypothetical protein WC889_02355 [Myxococcota bacterium]